jgi:hypothetical protein
VRQGRWRITAGDFKPRGEATNSLKGSEGKSVGAHALPCRESTTPSEMPHRIAASFPLTNFGWLVGARATVDISGGH